MIISGTVRSAVNQFQLVNRWKIKGLEDNSEEEDAKRLAEMTPEERQLKMFQDQAADMREGNAKSGVYNKLMSGQNLSTEELEYLRRNDPENYNKYKMEKLEQKAYEERLKRCKTKEDAKKLHMNRLSGHLSELKSAVNNANIPKGEKLAIAQRIQGEVNATCKIFRKFVESGAYGELPTEEEKQAAEAVERAETVEIAEAVETVKTVETAEKTETTETVETAEKESATGKKTSAETTEKDELTFLEKQVLDEVHKVKKQYSDDETKYSQIDVVI